MKRKDLIGKFELSEVFSAKIVSVSEDDLTKKIVIPLFLSLGYSAVNYNGGPYEGGKDVICWRTDDLGDQELMVCQVKKFKPTSKAKDNLSFSELVNQLMQASEKSVPNIDGNEYKPNKVYFITPFKIDTRALTTRFERYQEIVAHGLKIIDGSKLIDLSLSHIPDVVDDFLEIDAAKCHLLEQLNNVDLMSALGMSSCKDIGSFYADLEFTVGKISSTDIYSAEFNRNIGSIKVNVAQWKKIKKTLKALASLAKIAALDTFLDSVDRKFAEKMAKLSQVNNELTEQQNYFEDLSVTTFHAFNELSSCILHHPKKSNFLEVNGFEQDLVIFFEDVSTFFTLFDNRIKQYDDIVITSNKISATYSRISKEIYNICRSDSIVELLDDFIKKIQLLSLTVEKIYNLHTASRDDYVAAGIDMSLLVENIEFRRKYIDSCNDRFDEAKPCLDDLSGYVEEYHCLLCMFELILSNRWVKKLLIKKQNDKAKAAPLNRLSLSVHDIIDTGHDLILFGDAGAGKTTTLQFYFKNKIAESSAKEIMFIPLSRLYSTIKELVDNKAGKIQIEQFEEGILGFYSSIGYRMTKQKFYSHFSRPSVILFDGIDEVVKQIPNITDILADFKSRHKKCQIVLSSRTCGQYVKDFSCIGISLLPFTTQQRERFIRGWHDQDEQKARMIIEHVNKNAEIAEVVTNPLLATILCVLASHDIPLPSTEVRLYQERVDLLLGVYDVHKKIKRVSSDKKLLEIISQKIAFGLQDEGIRESTTEHMFDIAWKNLKTRYKRSAIEAAFKELIDPCNILVPGSSSGKYSFGHLRFQEYFAACELRNNRNIKLLPLLEYQWWKGVLVMFSMLTDDISFLTSAVSKLYYNTDAIDNFKAMLEVRSKVDRLNLWREFELNVEEYREMQNSIVV